MVRTLTWLAGLVMVYLAAAWLGGVVPVNRGWREAVVASGAGVTIYVASNGYHSGVMVPAVAAGVDWRGLGGDLAEPGRAGAWLFFGWGDRAFYLETPTLADLKPGTAVAALAGTGRAVVHVDHFDAPGELVDARRVVLTVAQYRRLTAFLRGSFARGADGGRVRVLLPGGARGYGARDAFYAARGRYSLRRTCNVWTGEALAAAGVRVGAWPVFSEGVMRWFPA